MTTLTLEALRAELTRLAELIAQFEAQPASECEQIHFPEVLIDLSHGEHYAGLIVGKDGEPSYHLVLLPGEAEEIPFVEANEWAVRQGGEYEASLPNRREQALLYANLKEHFADAWYWSSEKRASDAGYAWFQYFGDGLQDGYRQINQLRARAVRRLPHRPSATRGVD